MTEWFYKATPTKVSFEHTRSLALEEGFLCRSAYEAKNNSYADNVRNVDFGHLLHVYFCGEGEPRVIGTFRIVGPNKHALPGRFGKGVTGTKLFEIADPAFEQALRAMKGDEGYEPDPVLKKMTGWILKYRLTLPRRRTPTHPSTTRRRSSGGVDPMAYAALGASHRFTTSRAARMAGRPDADADADALALQYVFVRHRTHKYVLITYLTHLEDALG